MTTISSTLVGVVEAKGMRVLAVSSAVEAMRIIAQERVDVLFTDIVMPDQTGIKLARAAKRLRPDLQVMFATGYYSRAKEAGELGPHSTSRCARTRSKPSLIGFSTRGAASHRVS